MNNRGQKPYKYERIASELQKIIQEVVAYEISDPRVCGNCDVTDIELTRDYSYCKVFVEIKKTCDKKEVLDGLKNASGFIKHAIIDTLDLRKTPELAFFNDDTKEKQERIEELLKSIK